jgi:S-adenosylmethionine hydrolase
VRTYHPLMARPVISLLTDFGLRDPSAAICHGVILGIAPEAQIIDISHEVRKYAIRDGALLLWSALPYLPVGAHVAVVDPGVGTSRRAIAIRVERGDSLIGPDNGLLLPAAERLGGPREVRALENEDFRLPKVSSSFHGRDIFAPAAAHLANGARFANLGQTIALNDLVRLNIGEPSVTPGALESAIVYIDTFGNVKLAGARADLEAALGPIRPGDLLEVNIGGPHGRSRATEHPTFELTFAEVALGHALLYEDSYGRLCLADNQGDLAARLELAEDQAITIRRPI